MWACFFIAWLQARVFCRSPRLHGGLWSCQTIGNGSTYDGCCGRDGLAQMKSARDCPGGRSQGTCWQLCGCVKKCCGCQGYVAPIMCEEMLG